MKDTLNVLTQYNNDGIILQEVYSIIDNERRRIVQELMNTKEYQVRQALIALGWTPPDGDDENKE